MVLLAKSVVGLVTGSPAIQGNALHSPVDVVDNVLALGVMRISARSTDREHPYGHREFETPAGFGPAGLLTAMAAEVALSAVRPERPRSRYKRAEPGASACPWSMWRSRRPGDVARRRGRPRAEGRPLRILDQPARPARKSSAWPRGGIDDHVLMAVRVHVADPR